MNQAEIHPFLLDFFRERGGKIVHEENGLFKVQLTEALDEELMNRPFYWQYIKKLGFKGEPMSVTFITDDTKRNQTGEWVHFGSRRLEQFFQIIQRDGMYTELYEQHTPGQQQSAMYPWFVCNVNVHFNGYYTSDEIVSVGVLLTNGTMRFGMMEELESLSLSSQIPDYCYKIPSIIPPKKAAEHLMNELESRVIEKSKSFAEQSSHLYESELDLIRDLGQDLKDEEIKSMKQQIFDRLYPKVNFKVINGGLFYLTAATCSRLTSY
ncbi:hypothetical protein CEY16_04285 [Halalkalibacillus sediminis]|uniref:Uncharacterized protein n=1 Tax=Halalkalibacillus sediminis TaxID=2018042 RepID=A0A2I0QXE2_9BACI|nr:YqhG family protein [Halalkalibacillus sediminis]PKR78979.1 hypothetical protein CEY16_04285 [Halalkalibacillus sediminis]